MGLPLPDFSVRTRKILRNANVSSLDQLCRLTPGAILEFKNAGESVVAEIKETLAGLGRSLGEPSPELAVEATLRDLFAVQVATAYVAKNGFHDDIPPMVARAAYQVADAMLAERAKGGGA